MRNGIAWAMPFSEFYRNICAQRVYQRRNRYVSDKFAGVIIQEVLWNCDVEENSY